VKQIEFTVSPQGKVDLKTTGYAGAQCQDASAPFEAALGLKQRDTPTNELYATEAQPALTDAGGTQP
jgi:hypothetical protein